MVKVAIFSVALYYLYNLFVEKTNVSISTHIIYSFQTSQSWWMLLGIFLLQFINYGLENLKWRYSLPEIRKESFFTTWKAVYAGNSIAIFTPDRLGTFIGRFSYLKAYSKTKITYSTFVGNYAQLTTTMIFALIGMVLVWNYDMNFKLPQSLPIPTLLLIFTPITVILFSLFFYQEIIINWLESRKGKWFVETAKKLTFASQYKNIDLAIILFIAFLRYVVFVSQFYLATIIFQLPMTPTEILAFCGILYLFATLIPSPFMGNLGTREAVAVYLLSNINGEVAIIASSLLIWLINVIFPSILGGFIFLSKKSDFK